jgi:hypothetical protein
MVIDRPYSRSREKLLFDVSKALPLRFSSLHVIDGLLCSLACGKDRRFFFIKATQFEVLLSITIQYISDSEIWLRVIHPCERSLPRALAPLKAWYRLSRGGQKRKNGLRVWFWCPKPAQLLENHNLFAEHPAFICKDFRITCHCGVN